MKHDAVLLILRWNSSNSPIFLGKLPIIQLFLMVILQLSSALKRGSRVGNDRIRGSSRCSSLSPHGDAGDHPNLLLLLRGPRSDERGGGERRGRSRRASAASAARLAVARAASAPGAARRARSVAERWEICSSFSLKKTLIEQWRHKFFRICFTRSTHTGCWAMN